MDDLCTTCLSSGRNLYFLEDTECYHMYLQILNEIQVPDMRTRVCWECHAVLRRFQRFQQEARRCQLLLQDQGIPKYALSQPSRLSIQSVTSLSYPPLDIKLEPETSEVTDIVENIKVEAEDTVEHCEPETFVNDLELEKSEESKKPSKKKKKKLKGGKKKKKKLEEPMSDGFSDIDMGDDNVEDNDDKVEEKDEKDTKCICAQCGLTFEDRYALDRHVEGEHLKEAVVAVQPKVVRTRSKEVLAEKPTCTECGKVFSSRKTYRYHLNVLHKGQNRYPCPRCGKVYQWKSNLGRHLRTHKARDDGELYCALCDKRFASVATYRQHLRVSRRHVSESEFSFVCNECGKKFVNKTRLRDHVDWEHLKKIKFRCQLCNKPFKCHTSLYVHLQNVHRNKEKKDNLCHVCGKSYQNAAKLKYHIVAMHTRETPYQCGQCGAAFGWYSSLYRHIREVHYKMKVQPKKSKKEKKLEEMVVMPPPLPGPA